MNKNKIVIGMLELMLLIILFVVVITSMMLITGQVEHAVERFVWGVFFLVIILIIKCLIEMSLYKRKHNKRDRY
ncbi:MAG: hypothetical protein FWF56_06715 [Firmicutes bacterium]|nr:hypothetical protein [Bacillota bacterium]MCL1953575.1 hypothetical protein [Bacillota bacterium]